MADQAEYLRPEDVAKTYAVSVHTVCNWIQCGLSSRGRLVRLRALRVGRPWRIPRKAWDEFLEAPNGGPVVTAEQEERRRREREEASRRLDLRLNKGRGPLR